jgi:hypothetical protein
MASPPGATRPSAAPTRGLFLAKELREEDRIVFSDDTDAVGLPKMQLNYQSTTGFVGVPGGWVKAIGEVSICIS